MKVIDAAKIKPWQNPIAVAVIRTNSAFKARLERRIERPFTTA
jgi:hypothetical protein